MFGSVVMRGLVGAVSGVPILLSAVVQNESTAATALVLTYDQPMDQLAAINLANFALSLGITFASSSWTSATVLKLVMSTAMWIDESTTVSIAAAAVKSAVGVPAAAVVSSAVTNNSTRTPFNLSGAHDGYDAGVGVTNIAGQANAITDQTGQGNTLTAPASTGRPDIVANWRNGKTALLGRASAVLVGVNRGTFVNGALAQPFTRYIVGSTPTPSANAFLIFGVSLRCDNFITLKLASYASGVGAAAIAAPTVIADGTPFIWRTVFTSTQANRVEYPGFVPQLFSGASGNSTWGSAYIMQTTNPTQNWAGHWAWQLNIAGDLPTSQPALDARIMAWLQNRYNIVHL